jgi:hypothetical protein
MRNNALVKTITLTTIIIVIGLLLGLFTTSEYLRARGAGINSLERGAQFERHQAILEGHAGNPWQYRVLAPYLLNVIIRIFNNFHINHPIAIAFVFLRVVQDTFILLLSYAYYRELGLSLSHALIGMALLAWGISNSYYDSDLAFNTFFDIIFYLLAGLCILKRKYIWIVPITLLAALNRETSGLIPFLLIISVFILQKGSLPKVMPVFIIAVVTYVAIFVGLRLIYGKQELFIPYGHPPGLELLAYNLFRTETWRQLIATLSIIPIIAIIGYKKWPLQLRVFFWAIVPIWFVVHAFSAVMAESRLFLVPQAMVFIPGALYSLTQQAHPAEEPPLRLGAAGEA